MKIFSDYLKICILCLCLLPLSCSIAPELTKQEKEMLHEPVTPYSKDSRFSDALSNLGLMIETYGFPPTVIQGKNVVNKTSCQASLPLDITDMVKTAVNSIGNKIQYMIYDPAYEYYKFGDRFKLYGVTVTGKALPAVVIDGAITECDEKLESENSGINAYGTVGGGSTETDLDGGMGKNLSYSRLALDLHMMDFRTNRLIPKKQTAMAVDVWELEKSRSFGFRIYGSGLGIDGRRRKVQGKHNAVRSLVELSILKLIGRHLEIPYWRCIPGSQPGDHTDPEVIAMMKADFRKQKSEHRIGIIQVLLQKYGYRVNVNNRMDRATQTALRDFRTKHPGAFQIDENLYADLMLNTPMPFSGGVTAAVTSAPVPAAISKPVQTAASAPLSFYTAFVTRPGGNGHPVSFKKGDTLRSGDYYKIIIRPDEDCYVYVFQADSSGQFFQLFPLREFRGVKVNNLNPLQKGRIRTLPAEDKSFVLDRQTGTERIYIAASRTRNRELENLYADIINARSHKQMHTANRALKTYFSQKRGLAGIASEKTIPAAWKESGDIFSVMSQRLQNVCRDCVYVTEFRHQ
ncbi:MAG: DUF4384 domain-containing protein [Desulfococcaceae bacterium]|jgi:hypothetical protein|nr:DUF4384 domain-containing protein [Desulfococcaceae bacterium]